MEQKQAEFLAKWWANKLRGEENGNVFSQAQIETKSFAERAISAMVSWDSSERRNKPDYPAKVDSFESILKEKLLAVETRRLTLDVDYNPCRILSSALEESGIGVSLIGGLPAKTHTTVDGETITARCGYGAPFETIWP